MTAMVTTAAVAALAGAAITGAVIGIVSSNSSNSPIKIGGGAMTFRINPSSPQGGWQAEGNGFCVPFSPKSIVFDGDWHGNPTAPGLSKLGWSLVLNGGQPQTDPAPPSGNGIKVDENTTACNGKLDNGFALHLSPLNQTSAFYNTFSFSIRHETNGYQIVRFEDLTPGGSCTGPNPNAPGAPGSGDEDVCESLSQMTLTVNGSNKGPVTCDSQECYIELK
jgi:hypothetical protein